MYIVHRNHTLELHHLIVYPVTKQQTYNEALVYIDHPDNKTKLMFCNEVAV